MNLSNNLKKIRKDNNLSQEQLAEKLGVSRQSVSKWESNQAYPEMDKVLQICHMFNLNVDELLNQNIKEIKENKESKNNINKYIDDFLNFITKTVDLFGSMKFKDKIKCLIEQIIIIIILLIIFLIIGFIGALIISNFFYALPYEIYSLIFAILEGIYILIAIITGVVIFLHVFKVRYLDYYIIVNNNEDDDIKDKSNKKEVKQNKIYLEKKEKIIIRDPNHSGYKFIKGLIKCILFIIKLFVSCITISSLLPLIFLVIALIMSFIFIKTGILFTGTFLILISSITINLLVIYILYNFIFSKKTNRNRTVLTLIISVIILSIGIGLCIISIKDFDYINDINSKYYTKDEKTIEMTDNLLFEDFYSSYFEFIETNREDIKIECKHSKHYICDINVYNNEVYVHTYQKDTNLIEQLRENIHDINNKKIINYSNYKVIVYASKENINKLIENKDKNLKEIENKNKQNEIDYLNELLDEKNNEIRELQNKIYELENYIYE